MSNEPQPIETAITDGTVILAECGFCRFLNQRQWGSPINDGKWVECDPFGNIFYTDDGPWECDPKFWTTVPEWILAGAK